ncbi:beta-ketoacyl synthase chain length factor [Pseudomonas sp. gcc21]|uniref:beta-ketoacyl synthase chain length factor n=1 Tax=Pseudomonas sp. gcc21 TaxID=2726989 RepID=UPI0014520715|nr:beta-ketoacyl synthase chain length factor [Pseudomonas sp. gcc21]QJD59180.1 beta-ketoacyl synthase chain length factor [Pseudomonas sp. gcc21]
MKCPVYIEDWVAWTADSEFSIRPGHAVAERQGESMLPRMLRRRLSATGRAVCDSASVLDDGSGVPVIHASRHGDVSSSLTMLGALEAGDPVSPSSFSMSVHNAVLGVYSIARQHRGPTQALGACGNEFEALIAEATGYLATGKQAVIALFSEGEIPQSLRSHTEFPPCPCVVALRLTAGTGQRLLSEPASSAQRPTPLQVIDWLSRDVASLTARQRWFLEHA